MTVDELTVEAVFQIAVDAKGAQAGLKLVREGRYGDLLVSGDRKQLRARCQGSEPQPYDVHVDLTNVRLPAMGPYGIQEQCNCASFKRPCKHALGLLLAFVEAPKKFAVEHMKPSAPDPFLDEELEDEEEKPKPPKGTTKEIRETFLKTIYENPDDDAPRLMYADWLTEQDDPQGEFIRIQCELVTLPDEGERRPALVDREQFLLNKHGSKWRKPLLPAVKRMQPQFIRGFIGKVTTTATLFPKWVDAIFHYAPAVRALCLTNFLDVRKTARVAKCSELDRIAELDVGESGLGGNLVEVLLSTPFLKSLRSLDLSDNHLGPAGVRGVAGAMFLHELQVLTMRRCNLGPSAAEALAGSAWLSRLKVLDLNGNGLGNDGAKALAASPHLTGLQRLSLVDADVGPAGRKVLRDRFGDRVVLGEAS